MWTRFLLAFTIATGMRAQHAPTELLRLASAKVGESLDRLPRYMCTETIDRSRFEPDVRADRSKSCDEGTTRPNFQLTTSDRLRVDVAKALALEMYSWVGESKFNDRDLLDMVHEGALSTGSFGTYLASIFRSEDTNFTYNGDDVIDGRTLAEFGFHVPVEKSHHYFFYGDGQHSVTTSYDGTFLVDPKTADLVQLVFITSRLPVETEVCYASTTLDYARVNIKGSDFLLPKTSLFRVLHTDGGQSVNRTVFSNCHEFLGESTISFHTPPVVPETPHGATSKAMVIPEGLPFQVALTQGVDTATSAAGDPIKAKLITPILKGSEVLVPMGATINARIVRLRLYYSSTTTVLLEVKLETVNVGGVLIPLVATVDPGPSFQKPKRGTLQRRVPLGTLQSLEDRAATFQFVNVHVPYLIASGLESLWVTSAPAHSALTQTK
jgi:hypothetical protein